MSSFSDLLIRSTVTLFNKILLKKLEGKRSLRTPKHKCDIKMDMKETSCEGVDKIHLA